MSDTDDTGWWKRTFGEGEPQTASGPNDRSGDPGAVGDEDANLLFRSGEIVGLIAYLANATVSHGTAINALAAGDRDGAIVAVALAGEQIDAIIEVFRAKLGEDAFLEQR